MRVKQVVMTSTAGASDKTVNRRTISRLDESFSGRVAFSTSSWGSRLVQGDAVVSDEESAAALGWAEAGWAANSRINRHALIKLKDVIRDIY